MTPREYLSAPARDEARTRALRAFAALIAAAEASPAVLTRRELDALPRGCVLPALDLALAGVDLDHATPHDARLAAAALARPLRGALLADAARLDAEADRTHDRNLAALCRATCETRRAQAHEVKVAATASGLWMINPDAPETDPP